MKIPTSAETIWDQLNTLNKMAVWAWGTNGLVSSKPNKDHNGFLEFKVRNCSKVPNGTRIRISLAYNDTYTVKAYTVREVRGKADYAVKTLSEMDIVYVDMLIDVIDGMVG